MLTENWKKNLSIKDQNLNTSTESPDNFGGVNLLIYHIDTLFIYGFPFPIIVVDQSGKHWGKW